MVPVHAQRVLIAAKFLDDQKTSLNALLESDGIGFDYVQTGPRVLADVLSGAYSLILLDQDLPGGGIEICRRLNSLPTASVPVILRLAADNPVHCNAALAEGVLHCLPQTAGPAEIYFYLRNALRMKVSPQPSSAMQCVRSGLDLGQCVLDILPCIVIVTDEKHRIVGANASAAELAGSEGGVLLHKPIADVFKRYQFSCDFDWLMHKLAMEDSSQCELHGWDHDGNARVFWLHARNIKDQTNQFCSHHLFSLFDIAPLKRQEMRLRALAETDALTGVANRNLFLARTNEAIEAAEAGSSRPAILFLDLDGFKDVNDNFGHARGDQVLREVAGILQACVRIEDLVARLGGDEFAVLMLGAPYQALVETAERILERLVLVHSDQSGLSIAVTSSIGIAVFPEDGVDAASLLKQADKAMYSVKRRGKNGYLFASETTAK
ncbi:MAG: diguanylate cyclase [Parasulfuritortus sp.]|nr:diguanylate cyclase [Parasulfuritortus sp.]